MRSVTGLCLAGGLAFLAVQACEDDSLYKSGPAIKVTYADGGAGKDAKADGAGDVAADGPSAGADGGAAGSHGGAGAGGAGAGGAGTGGAGMGGAGAGGSGGGPASPDGGADASD